MESAADVVTRLGLRPHPEGGHYREVYRSGLALGVPPGYPGARSALTAIHFLLARGEFSAFHRVRGEEAWVHLAGAPLELVVLEENLRVHHLGAAAEGATPLAVVPPGGLQAARSAGAWSLAACLVAPGFEFADFEMPDRDALRARYPAHDALICRFTR
ncbi:MAG: cupin domain-containing protein [Deferrisomatales bacterium]